MMKHLIPAGNLMLSDDAVRMVARKITDDAKFVASMNRQVIEPRATLSELATMMRRELLMAMTTGTFADHDSTMEGDLYLKYAEMSRDTHDPATGTWRLNPIDVFRTWMEAQEWCRARINADIWLGNCDMGRSRRFISERAHGLMSALTQLNTGIRYDLRAQMTQIRIRDGSWVNVDDRLESRLRDTIADLFHFMRQPKRDSDLPKAVPAAWSNASWRVVMNATIADHPVDSFFEWSERLPPWDRTCRLDNWLEDCGFEFAPDLPDDLLKWASRSIPLIAATRTLRPGAKHDTTPVLIGPQAAGKSTALAWLMPPEGRDQWFTDTLKLSGSEQRRIEAMQGAVIVEIAEMSGATTAEIESMKAFLSRTHDRFRLAWRLNPEPNPRMCSFVGTANGESVLPNDPSGNRRFVALPVLRGNPSLVRRTLDGSREQLWAEAFHRAREGETTWLPEELAAGQSTVNEFFRSSDEILEEEVSEWLSDQYSKGIRQVTAKECAREILIDDRDKVGAVSIGDVRRIGRALSGLKCTRATSEKGSRARKWQIPRHFGVHDAQ